MLNRFTFRPSTYNTFAISSSLSKKMIPFPFIWDLLPSPKVTLPPFLDSNSLKRVRSRVMCLEQPLLRYYRQVFITLKAECINKSTKILNTVENKFNIVICLLIGKTFTRQKPYQINFRSPLSKIY